MLKEAGLKLFLSWRPTLFVKRTARELLFQGYSDPLLTAGAMFAKGHGQTQPTCYKIKSSLYVFFPNFADFPADFCAASCALSLADSSSFLPLILTFSLILKGFNIGQE